MSSDYRESHLGKGADYDSDLAKGGFNAFMTERERVLVPQIVRGLFGSTPPKYLDFACGTGRITSLIEPLTRTSFGVDVSASMVAEAAKKCPNTRFVIRDLTRQPLDDRDFDLATAFRFFGNAQDDLRRAVFAAVAFHLRPGGYFVFNNHRNHGSARSILQRASGRFEDHADLDLAKLKSLVAPAGLVIERTVGIGWWQLAHRLDTPGAYDSVMARLVEPLSTLNIVAPYCPAYIVVAKKVGGVS